MRRLWMPLGLLLAMLLAASLVIISLGRPDGAADGPGQVRIAQVDPAGYPEVSLYLEVRDEAGRPLGGLGRDDFQISEDGAPVELIDFAGAGAGGPISAALVIDRSGSMEEAGKIEGAQEAAAAFVRLLRPGDEAAIIAFNDEVELERDFTGDAAALGRTIDGLDADGGTALYDAVLAGVDLLAERPGRRLLLVLADGQDCSAPFDSCPDDAGSASSLDEAIAAAAAAGQPVVLIGLGARDDSGDGGVDEGVLQEIADGSGGQYLYAPRAADLEALYAGLASAAQQEYRISYRSPRPFYDGTRRDIVVEVAGLSGSGAYTERHLINVASHPLVGLGLLLPLLGLLAAPRLLAARRRSQGHAPVAALAPGAPPAPTAAAPDPVTIAQRSCASCGAPLRLTARFCSRCGATQ